jgi:hypothetical protein
VSSSADDRCVEDALKPESGESIALIYSDDPTDNKGYTRFVPDGNDRSPLSSLTFASKATSSAGDVIELSEVATVKAKTN